MPIEARNENDPLAPVTIVHGASGSKATIHPYGANIISFQVGNEDVLFVSKLAKTDGSKAIRGGVPLAFPQFGPQPDTTMPQHGFLRINTWTVGKSSDADDCAACEFHLNLSDVKKGRGEQAWKEGTSLDCRVSFLVKVGATSLTSTLTMTNTGTESFPFQALYHTYYRVPESKALESCKVFGLGGYSCRDKIKKDIDDYVQPDDVGIIVDCEVDRVYTPPASKPNLEILLHTKPGDSPDVKIEASATVGKLSTVVPVSAVVWNPFIDKSKTMGDFHDEEYKDMICVEPGIISGVPSLQGGESAQFTEVIHKL